MTPKWKKGLAVFLCAAMIASGSMAVSAEKGEQLLPQTNVETYGTTPEGTTPEGTTPEGITPEGTTPEGTTPEGTTPDGTTPDGTTPDGTTPDGTTPDGMTPEGTTPEGTTPEGTTPEGTTPEGITPEGTTPEGITPEGTTPDVTPSTNTGIMLMGGPSVLAEKTVSSMEELKNAIDNASDGAVITLTADIADAVGIAVASEKNFTLDFAEHTYTLKDPGAGSTGTETNGFQLLKDSTITFKNGIVRIEPGQTNIKRIIQNYADLTLENMKFYTANQADGEDYALSFNNGNIVFKGETDIISSNENIVAFDACYWSAGGYTDGVSVIFDDSYTGTITGKIIYDSTDKDKAHLEVRGNGSFGSIDKSEASCETPDITIYGGKFTNKNLPNEYLAEGLVQDGNGNIVSKETGTFQVNNESELTKALSDGIKNIQLAKDITVTTAITIPAGVTLDGGTHKLSFTGTLTNGAFVTAGGDNVTIQNITVDAGTNAKHGIQFYCAKGGKLSNVTVKGGYYTSVQVNGSEVEISNCNLQPTNKESGKSYTNIEYSMGKGVTSVPRLQISNVTGDTSDGRPLVYMDQDTVNRIIKNAEANKLEGITGDSTIQEIVNALYEQSFNNATSIAVNSDQGIIVYVPKGATPSPDPDPTPKPEDKPSSGNSSSSSGSSSSGNGGSSTPFVSMFTKKLEALKEKENASRVVLKDKKTNVTVSGEKGVLSADLKLKVTKVDEIASSLSDKLGTFLLYDIKLVDENGNTVQPKGTVTVGIPVPEGFDIDKLVVYYIDEEGNLIEYPVVVKDGVAYFETDHFSYYALAEKQGNSLTTQSTTETQTDSNKPNPSTGAQDLTAVLAAAAVSFMGLVVLGKKKH